MIPISTQNKIEQIFAQYTQPGSPGCVLAVIKAGNIIFQSAYGLANLEIEAPLTSKSIFNIGSISKQFTAFTIALLAADGKLSLDDDLRLHLPEMHDFDETITLRHLIHHTSGVRDSFPALLALAEWRDSDATTTQDVFKLLKAQRSLNFSPGSAFEYSNSNYVLLAKICEQVSGQSFSEFCRERIFDPLDMQNTYINASYYNLIPGRTLGYYDNGQGGWINAPLTDSVIGPTNIYTTVLDLAKWDKNLTIGAVGGEFVCGQMHQSGKLNNGVELDYAFGLEIGPAHQHHGWQMVEHGGSQGGYASWMMRFPEAELSVVLLCNHFMWEARDYALRVADIFLDEHPSQRTHVADPLFMSDPVELSATQLAGYVGIYFDAEHIALRNITLAEIKLQFEGLELIPLEENLFCFKVEPQTHIHITPAANHRPAEMKTITSSGEYRYVRVDAVSLTPDDLAAYVGRYYSPELDIYWKIVLDGNQLTVQRRKYSNSQLATLFEDTFRDDWTPLMGYPTSYVLQFRRNNAREITGLSVSGNGVRHLDFERA